MTWKCLGWIAAWKDLGWFQCAAFALEWLTCVGCSLCCTLALAPQVSGALHLLQAPASPWGSKSAEYEAGGKESVPRKGSGMLRFKATSRELLSGVQLGQQAVEQGEEGTSSREQGGVQGFTSASLECCHIGAR